MTFDDIKKGKLYLMSSRKRTYVVEATSLQGNGLWILTWVDDDTVTFNAIQHGNRVKRLLSLDFVDELIAL